MLIFVPVLVSPVLAADPGVTLIGVGFIAGDALDKPGLLRRGSCSNCA